MMPARIQGLFAALCVLCLAAADSTADSNDGDEFTSVLAEDSLEDGCCCSPAIVFSAEYLYLQPRRSGLDFAISDPNTDRTIEGPVNALELDSNSGLRASIGFFTRSNAQVLFTYTSFDADDQQSIAAPPGGRLWLTRTHPSSTNQFAFTADAATNTSFDIYDLDAGFTFFPNNCVSVRVFGGLRAAEIESEFRVSYTGGTIAGGNPVRTQIERTDVRAFGARAGGEAHWYLLNSLGLFGRLSGGVLFGDFSLQHIEREETLGGDVNVSYKFFDAVPVMESAVGITGQHGNVTIQAGYELSVWFNTDQRFNFTGLAGTNQGQFTSVRQDIALDGLFFRVIYTR